MRTIGRWCLGLLCAAACVVPSVSQSAESQYPFRVNLRTLRRSVIFIHLLDDDGRVVGAGTGFLLAIPIKSAPKMAYKVLVTARHVVDPRWLNCPHQTGKLSIVFNKLGYDPASNGPGIIEKPFVGVWHFPKDESVDLAVGLFAKDSYPASEIDNDGFPVWELPKPEELKRVGTGSQIVSAGLLLGASGVKHNYPIFKFGNVSSIPEEKVLISDDGCMNVRPETAWMIAASLVSGNSGSPIVYSPPPMDGSQRTFLLGVQSSAFGASDVAGMAPVQYLVDMLPDLGLPDADLRLGLQSPKPSNSK